MPANTNSVIGAFKQAASGAHAFVVAGVVPVSRGNKDFTFHLGSIWSYITPCRLADMVTPVPNILAYQVEFFLTDLNSKTFLYFNNTSAYLPVIDTVDARVQVYIPVDVQLGAAIVPGNYFHLLRITAPDGTVLVQTKGRVAVTPMATALPIPTDNDPYALSQATPTVAATSTTSQPQIQNAVFPFNDSSTVWNVNHSLGSYPAIVTVDTTGTRIYGQEQYLDDNNVQITFDNP